MRLSKQLNTLSPKDMSVLREADSIKTQVKLPPRGVLRDYSLQHRVVMEWDLNTESTRDRVFRLKVDDYSVLIDAEELLRYVRLV